MAAEERERERQREETARGGQRETTLAKGARRGDRMKEIERDGGRDDWGERRERACVGAKAVSSLSDSVKRLVVELITA